MLRLLTACLAVSFCALAQQSALNLHPRNFEQQPEDVRAALRAELQRVLLPLNAGVHWRTAPDPMGQDGRLVVVNFVGSCSFHDYNPVRTTALFGALPLASTAVTNGRVLPFVTIECARIRDRIASEVIGLRAADRDAALGRGVARVLAHEIYHVLTGDRKHTSEGIAAECLSGRQLLAERFDLDDRSLAMMRPAAASPELVPSEDELDPDFTGR